MEEKRCLSVIKSEYNNLTAKEKLIADYILKNHDKVIKMSVGELAEDAGVVKSAVIRCCKSLGFSGFSDLKFSLARENVRNEQFNYVPYINEGDSTVAIMEKIFSANIKTLHDTLEGIDREILTGLVELLKSANNIYIYGIGTSAGIVSDFQYRLMQLGFMAFSFTDIVAMRVSTLNIKKGDVAIGISNSGRTKATVEALELAKKRGAKVASVTSYKKSPIVKVSDFPIVIYTDEIQYPIEAISSRIAHISVLDSICIALSAKDYNRAVKLSGQIHDMVDDIRE